MCMFNIESLPLIETAVCTMYMYVQYILQLQCKVMTWYWEIVRVYNIYNNCNLLTRKCIVIAICSEKNIQKLQFTHENIH